VDRTAQQWQIPEGTDVVGSDGDKVGKVVAAESSYIVVEKGFFFPTDYYIPTNAISTFDGDKVYLTVTKDEALNQGWDQQLTTSDDSVLETQYARGAGAVDNTLEGDRFAGVTPTGLADNVDMGATDTTLRDAGIYADTTRVANDRAYDTTATDVTEGDTLRVPVHEEELTATTRPVERGEVRVDKRVVEEDRTLEVPVSEERVTITRRAVDRDTGVDDLAFQEDTIEIPLRSEEVDVQKRNRVVEEIDIAKDTVQRTERVTDTVRREQVNVDEATTGTTSRFVDSDVTDTNR
jgi:uncharacterized protein (TIGR02271 family)